MLKSKKYIFLFLIFFVLVFLSGFLYFKNLVSPADLCGSKGNEYEKDRCIEERAFQANDFRICDKIKDTEKVYSIGIFGPDGGLVTKNWCYTRIAEKTSNLSICKRIEDEASKNECFTRVARKTGTLKTCDAINDAKKREWCQLGVAEVTKNHSICEGLKINDDNHMNNVRDACFQNLAPIVKDVSLCANVFDLSRKKTCYTDVMRSVAVFDEGTCQNLTDQTDKDACWNALSEKNSKSDTCDKMIDATQKDSCLFQMALRDEAGSLCDKVADSFSKDKCYCQVSLKVKDFGEKFALVDKIKDPENPRLDVLGNRCIKELLGKSDPQKAIDRIKGLVYEDFFKVNILSTSSQIVKEIGDWRDLRYDYPLILDDKLFYLDSANGQIISFDYMGNLKRHGKFEMDGHYALSKSADKIMFARNKNGLSAIYISDLDGSNSEKIDETSKKGFVFEPLQWSDDGKDLYYIEKPQEIGGGYIYIGIIGTIYHYNFDQKKIKKVIDEAVTLIPAEFKAMSGRYHAISGDNRYIAYEAIDYAKKNKGAMILIDFETKKSFVFPVENSDERAVNPHFSPDYKFLVFNEFVDTGDIEPWQFNIIPIDLQLKQKKGKYYTNDEILGWIDEKHYAVFNHPKGTDETTVGILSSDGRIIKQFKLKSSQKNGTIKVLGFLK
jgi:hypothetical protein